MARGEYILFLDQDDEIADDFIDSQLKRIEDADVVVANGYRVFNDRKKLLYKKETIGRWLNKYDMFVYGTCLIFSPGQCLIKRTSIPKEWCELLLTQNGSDDYLLWLIMLQKNNRFVFNNKPLYSHKEHENNFSTSSQNMIAAFDAVITVLEKNRMVDKKHLRALCKRLEIKKTKRSIQSYAYMIGNPQILLYTMLYKFNGFH
jgi:glycosyltransferase involved in cell wall biosynthesis